MYVSRRPFCSKNAKIVSDENLMTLVRLTKFAGRAPFFTAEDTVEVTHII